MSFINASLVFLLFLSLSLPFFLSLSLVTLMSTDNVMTRGAAFGYAQDLGGFETGSDYDDPMRTMIDLDKPPTHQASVTINCRTHRDLQERREEGIRRMQDADISMIPEEEPLNSEEVAELNKDDDSYEVGDADYDPIAVEFLRNIRRSTVRRRLMCRTRGRSGPVTYYTPTVGGGVYALANHDLAFRDPSDNQLSRESGVRVDPYVFSSWNNLYFDPNNPPICVGITDTPGDLKKGTQIRHDGAVVAAAGTRSTPYWNVDGTPGYAGDRVNWRPPVPPRSRNGKLLPMPQGGCLAGTPEGKLLPQLVAMNLAETGNGNHYTQLLGYLLGGSKDQQLHEYLSLTAASLEEQVEGFANQVEPAGLSPLFLSKARKAQKNWADNLEFNELETDIVVDKYIEVLGLEEKLPEGSIRRQMAEWVIKQTLLLARTHSRQTHLQATTSVGMLMSNTASGTVAEINIDRGMD